MLASGSTDCQPNHHGLMELFDCLCCHHSFSMLERGRCLCVCVMDIIDSTCMCTNVQQIIETWSIE